MERIINILKEIKNILFFIVIFALLIVIQFKNSAIKNLKEEVATKPVIEYVYNTDTVTVVDTIVDIKETIKYKDKILVQTDSVPIELTQADSMQIAKAYNNLYTEYNSVNIYDNVLKDDSLAYIKLYEEVSQNTIFNRKLDYQDRTPVIYITNTVTKQDKTLSLVGGIGASIGKETNSLSLGLGMVTPSNRIYLFQYDPVNNGYGAAIYMPVFNIKSKK